MLYFSKKVGENGKIFSIESDPRVYEVLKEIVILNNLKNVYLINNFFYKKNNIEVKSRLLPLNNWMSNSINSLEGEIFKSKTVTIDSVIKKFNINKINFAKFNIEGSEKNLLSGNKIFLKKCENICVSCHDFLEKKQFKTFYQLKKFFLNKNFKVHKNLSQDKILKFYLYAKKK